MNYLSSKDISIILRNAIANKKPFSMVRLGDGEFSIIKYPKFTKEKLCRARIGRWFDSSKLTRKQIVSIRNQILNACKTADILGVPNMTEQRIYLKWRQFIKICDFYKLFKKRQRYYYFYLVKDLNYKLIFKNIDMLYCITCRNIGKQIEKNFNIKMVETFLIPPERFAYSKSVNSKVKWDGLPHYPELYLKIQQWLDSFDLHGKIFLVGAGGLGKIYCLWIKQRGGIAMDIGALFDAWAGLYTRPYYKKPIRFKLK